MNTNEFDTLMNIVYSRWGAKAYPEAVRNRVWYFVKDLPAKAFERIIYRLLDTQRAAPMPHEFKMLAYGEKDALGISHGVREPETKPSREAKCWDCGDSGNLFVRHKTKGTSAVCRCHCAVGSGRPPAQGLQWGEAFCGTWNKEPKYVAHQGDWRPKVDQRAIDMIDFLRATPLESKRHRSGELEKFGGDE